MGSLISEVYQNRELIWALALKDIRVRYKRSALGFLWALLNPLFMMIILAVVFSTVMRVGISHYTVFLICGLLPWTFLTQALVYSVESIVGNGDLMKKIYIAKSVFPIAAVLSNIINFLFSLITMVIVLAVLRFPFHWTWLYLPVPFIGLVLFAIGIGFFLAMANVFFRDAAQTLQVVLSAWFYISPVIYSTDMVPQRFQILFRLNPMLYILDGFRSAIYYGRIPSAGFIAATLGSGIVATLVGYSLFRRFQDSLIFYV